MEGDTDTVGEALMMKPTTLGGANYLVELTNFESPTKFDSYVAILLMTWESHICERNYRERLNIHDCLSNGYPLLILEGMAWPRVCRRTKSYGYDSRIHSENFLIPLMVLFGVRGIELKNYYQYFHYRLY